MKAITYLTLIHELQQHPYGIGEEYNVENLFRIYSKLEINSFADLYKDHKSFYTFVLKNANRFNDIEHTKDGNIPPEMFRTIKASARHLYFTMDSIKNKYYSDYHKDQEKFVKLVEDIIDSSRPKILEVGSGSIPYSSILLAHDIGRISSMDHFAISAKSLDKLYITPYNRFFTNNEDISNYDLIIGQRPCSAISDIVTTCTNAKKSYLLQLCGCNSPTKLPSGWIEYLSDIDPSIKFSFDNNEIYACNLDNM